MRHRTQIQSSDADLPESREIDLSSNKPLDDDELHLVTGESMGDERIKNLLKEEHDMRTFMEEKVTFMIAETSDKNAPNPVSAGVNGIQRHFWRGKQYTEARKFIDSLIKVTFGVKTINFTDEKGLHQTKIETVPSMVYPIQILSDPSGRIGHNWFLHQQKNGF